MYIGMVTVVVVVVNEDFVGAGAILGVSRPVAEALSVFRFELVDIPEEDPRRGEVRAAGGIFVGRNRVLPLVVAPIIVRSAVTDVGVGVVRRVVDLYVGLAGVAEAVRGSACEFGILELGGGEYVNGDGFGKGDDALGAGHGRTGTSPQELDISGYAEGGGAGGSGADALGAENGGDAGAGGVLAGVEAGGAPQMAGAGHDGCEQQRVERVWARAYRNTNREDKE